MELEFNKLLQRVATLENLVANLIQWTHYDYKTDCRHNDNNCNLTKIDKRKKKNSTKVNANWEGESDPLTNFEVQVQTTSVIEHSLQNQVHSQEIEIEQFPGVVIKVEDVDNWESETMDDASIIYPASDRVLADCEEEPGDDDDKSWDNGESSTSAANTSILQRALRPPPAPAEDEEAAESTGRPFRCKSCWRSFKLKENMIKHHNLVHLRIKKCSCRHCSRTFRDNFNLSRHMNRVHPSLS